MENKDYAKYVKYALEVPLLTNLIPDNQVYRISPPEGHAVPYCTFRFYDEGSAFNAGGQEVKTRYYLQIDINSNTDYTEIENAIRNIALNNDWKKGAIFEGIDPDTKLYFKCMRYTFDL